MAIDCSTERIARLRDAASRAKSRGDRETAKREAALADDLQRIAGSSPTHQCATCSAPVAVVDSELREANGTVHHCAVEIVETGLVSTEVLAALIETAARAHAAELRDTAGNESCRDQHNRAYGRVDAFCQVLAHLTDESKMTIRARIVHG